MKITMKEDGGIVIDGEHNTFIYPKYKDDYGMMIDLPKGNHEIKNFTIIGQTEEEFINEIRKENIDLCLTD